MHLLPDSLEHVSVKSGPFLQMIESLDPREKQNDDGNTRLPQL